LRLEKEEGLKLIQRKRKKVSHQKKEKPQWLRIEVGALSRNKDEIFPGLNSKSQGLILQIKCKLREAKTG
jgi:hypothetical protein